MNSETGCTRLCKDCPRLPRGVIAEVTDISAPTDAEMRAEVYGSSTSTPWQTREDNAIDNFCVTYKVIESTNPEVSVGDEATEKVNTRGLGASGIRTAFEQCSGPRQPNLVMRTLGAKPRCGATDEY
jgi:hypothetical protein